MAWSEGEANKACGIGIACIASWRFVFTESPYPLESVMPRWSR
jgi:hypothetical protein